MININLVCCDVDLLALFPCQLLTLDNVVHDINVGFMRTFNEHY
uniref:Uncharacterized protein n=1 Tax=Arundo donax TaxID=35708 RepID=A0A0A9CLZ7_ARUDO